ncbi:MAG: helix-hairpin-helix domain-containing protein [Bacteroidales bacterium]|nr:helix-hairpin-helix domain-containing protein [Bacteroidales bacterium]
MYKYLYILFLINFVLNSFSQIVPDDDFINSMLELTVEHNDKEDDFNDIFEQLEVYRHYPLDLNKASAAELKQLIYLNDLQIGNLIAYRNKYGNLFTVYELQAIDGFYLEVIFKILPYVCVKVTSDIPDFTLKDIANKGKSRISLKYQQIEKEQEGYKLGDSSGFVGSPQKYYFQYRFNYYDNLSFGITAEKDAGEEFFKGSQKQGFDFYSAHLFVKNTGRIKSLAIGDYQLGFGQGLTLWTGTSLFEKSLNPVNIGKAGDCIRPYTSTDENNFLRGMATTIKVRPLEVSTFYSQKKRDANLNQDKLTVSSLQESGLHSTRSEIDDKQSLDETNYGVHLKYKQKRFELGATSYRLYYDKALQRDFQPYNQYKFYGNKHSGSGIDYSYSFNNLNISGEVARSGNNKYAYLNRIILSPAYKFTFSFLYRNYDKNYYSVLSNAFSENTEDNNEKGFYTGLLYRINDFFLISGYADIYSFPWLRYGIDAPSKGANFAFKINYQLTDRLMVYFMFRNKKAQQNFRKTENNYNVIEAYSKYNYRVHFEYKPIEWLKFKTRAELVTNSYEFNTNKAGFILYQDFNLKTLNNRYNFMLRYALFDTDTYDERIYVYENDLPHSYSIIPYYFRGSRFYIVHLYKIANIELWIKYSQSCFPYLSSIGTGLYNINSNTKPEIKVELRLNL